MEKKIKKNIIYNMIIIFALFLTCLLSYIIIANRQMLTIRCVGYSYLVILLGVFIYLLLDKKLTFNRVIILILLLGFGLRIIYASYNNIFSRQHDVGKAFEKGHYGYAVYIFRNNSLVNTNEQQFYQPPLNAVFQAIWMKIISVFKRPDDSILELYKQMSNNEVSFKYNNELIVYIDSLYNYCRVLSAFYSCLTLFIIHKILKELNLKDYIHIIALLFLATQPVLVMMSGTMNNDNISYLFFFLALLFAIKWFKMQTYLNIILIAIFIGLGMISKLSIGFIAFIIGPMMLYILIRAIKNKNYKHIIIQLAVFAIIVFPLGLSYAIRNYVLFKQPLTYILDFKDHWNPILYTKIRTKNFFERYVMFPFNDIISDRGIYHDMGEYNIWMDLLKTSTFEEFSYTNNAHIFAGMMLTFNFLLYLLAIASIIYLIIGFIKKSNNDNKFAIIMCLAFVVLALFSYISLNIKMPYSCTSNFRYISYLAFANILLTLFALDKLKFKPLTYISSIIVLMFSIFTSLFILVI